VREFEKYSIKITLGINKCLINKKKRESIGSDVYLINC